MLRFGIVTAINPLMARARVEFADDDMNSFWLPVLQKKTLKDKYYVMVDVGEQVVCLMDENSEDGVILGSIYTNLDAVPAIFKEQHMVKFDDGHFIEYNKETKTLTVFAENLNIIANVVQTGTLKNSDGITSDADITDKKSSMQKMRDIYNAHKHTGNLGASTSSPDGSM